MVSQQPAARHDQARRVPTERGQAVGGLAQQLGTVVLGPSCDVPQALERLHAPTLPPRPAAASTEWVLTGLRSTVTAMPGSVVRGALVAALLFALAGCGGGGEPSRARSTTTTTAPGSTLVGFSECTFTAGGPVTKAGLATAGPNLAVSWDTPKTIPDSDSSALVITLGPYRIGFERDGVKLSRFLFDSTTGARTELTGSFTEAEQGISMSIPVSEVPLVKPRTRWHASVDIDGTQVARCPETGSSRFGDKRPK
jgi:hypothetical protein